MSKQLAIIPAYNEEAAIAQTIDDLRLHAPDFDILVVDDGSTDRTLHVARSHGATVVSLPFNLGIGGAVQTGYQHAAQQGYDIAVQIDGDGQHAPRHLGEMVGYLREHPEVNMVTGSRFMVGGQDNFRSTAARRLGIRLFARVLSRIVGQPVTDPTSGMRMVDRRGIELFGRDYPHDYPEVEAVLLLHFHRLRSAELPVRMQPRLSGVSSINATRSAYYMVKVLLAILVGLLRARPNVEPGDPAPVAADHTL